MREIGNARADKLYGSTKAMASLPAPDAPHSQWLDFFKAKYEQKRWANDASEEDDDKGSSKQNTKHLPKQQEVVTEDLLGLHKAIGQQSSSSNSQDFFAQFNL